MSDGEVQEGQTWEAVQAAAHHGIDNLWAIMDVNRQQCDGAMDSVMTVGDIATKLRDFGAVVAECDAHDLGAMRAAATTPHPGRPLIVLAHSHPAHGMQSLMSRFPRLHYVRFKSEEERARMNTEIAAELGVAPVVLEAH
jgi:transketolase